MRQLVAKIILFLVILFLVDTALGICFQTLVDSAKGGETRRVNYICKQTSEDLLIFGSSRALHHYDPLLLEDSLQMSCYNCGKDGNGIILLYGWFKMIQQRYHPQMIVYDVMPNFDLWKGDNMAYLPGLRYYYGEPAVDSIFWSVDKNERFKMMVQSYRFNSQFLQIMMDNIKPLRKNINGYVPLERLSRFPYFPCIYGISTI